MKNRPIKVLHLPSSVGGNAVSLACGERKLGLDSQALSVTATQFKYPTNIDMDQSNLNLIAQFVGRLKAFLKYRQGYDVYHFNFGSSLIHAPQYGLNLLDLPYYDKRAVKIMTYQGCDARQKYPTMRRVQQYKIPTSAACLREDCYNGICNSGKRDQFRQRTIEKASRYVHHMFALNPDLLHFLPAEKSSFLPYTIANFDDFPEPKASFFDNDKIRIAHAPTQRGAKGSALILKIIADLQLQFPNRIVFDLIENLPHDQALKRYAQADLFIDQIYIGWYGAAAVEAMKLGVPVAVYINPHDLCFIPTAMAAQLPFLPVSVFDLKERLIDFVQHREMVWELRRNSLEFVNHWHAPETVAKITLNQYQVNHEN